MGQILNEYKKLHEEARQKAVASGKDSSLKFNPVLEAVAAHAAKKKSSTFFADKSLEKLVMEKPGTGVALLLEAMEELTQVLYQEGFSLAIGIMEIILKNPEMLRGLEITQSAKYGNSEVFMQLLEKYFNISTDSSLTEQDKVKAFSEITQEVLNAGSSKEGNAFKAELTGSFLEALATSFKKI